MLYACTRPVILAMALTVAVCVSADAQPKRAVVREVVSPLPDVVVMLPAAGECGTATLIVAETTVHVPKQGRFIQRCVHRTIVDDKNTVLSSGNSCDPPVFSSCNP